MPLDPKKIAEKNKQNIKKVTVSVERGAEFPYSFAVVDGQPILLIGAHNPDAVGAVRSNRGSTGTISVNRGGMLGPGEMTVTGFHGDKAAFQRAIADFSRKRVKFA